MSRKILLPILIIFMFSVLISRAQKSKHAALKDGNAYARLVASHQWNTVKNGQKESGYHFTITWKGTKPPETFFWRPKEGGWMTCEVKRLHSGTAGNENATEDIDLADIRKGDTLDVTPLRGGRDIMPKLIPASMTNRLFFTVKGNSNWWYVAGTAKKKK